MLRSPSHVWEKLYSVPKPEVLKYYLFSLVVSADKIIVSGDKRNIHDNTIEVPYEMDPGEPENFYFWMLDRGQGTWIDMANAEMDYSIWSQILFEMRLDAITAQGTWIDMANPELDYIIWSQVLFKMRLDAIS